jgi:hypothetical protein
MQGVAIDLRTMIQFLTRESIFSLLPSELRFYLLFLSLSHESEWPPSLAACQIHHPTYFDPANGGSLFL